MIKHIKIDDSKLHQKIKQKEIAYGGNHNLKIYGTLNCKSGKRMKKKNRVFFTSIEQAKKLGYRPCGQCMKAEYKLWKNGFI
ncbi:metal-binding protein [Salegentibacter sp. LM13S]|uniref:Ada metal-binding domain-containing protein n=1 Tax=Salegentibacter lacus TaxID=2873599 RepID=UPI001CCB51B1|nr:Ada metal-binding domain-containing protein [Salegentibacter lacus]MBZ9630449.1 metal-binding protein [Salegentibacter lacus]